MNVGLFRNLILSFIFISSGGYAAENLKFSGELVRQPCVLSPGDENIPLDFGEIIDKYLYAHERVKGQTITIHLQNCDTSLAKMIRVSFTGAGNDALPGYLSVSSGDINSGLAIGLENTSNGNPININNGTNMNIEINPGTMDINFNAFVRGEPKAIANKTISRGVFNAILNFSLIYE
ncbi:fimbrial protein [Serratia fonticola]|uniref:fimbrial protein n=1 Tax=Serratia fonticola TaxID=47917 RepID=UPI0027F284BA|nr:fimbrial protein [Serratia fonticola]MDQ7211308.1 fimbrial protein [Serratia fonticola]HBE9081371.1 type 1 fimbrial protein [Serratia fonticola]HBE9091994.1 type 1 fimbrial protein [Serratia fonticola]HBE9154862.1 type 1 fimbrial protein [Serratia fonticola]